MVAETRNEALNGAEAIEVEYESLEPVTSVEKSLDENVPIIHQELGSNIVFEVNKGDSVATTEVFKNAEHLTSMTLVSNRVAGNPMEPRSFLANYDSVSERYTLWCTSQIPHYFRRWLAKFVLFEPENHIRVVSPDVGGGFGLKIHLNEGNCDMAPKIIGRPVKWTATRQNLLFLILRREIIIPKLKWLLI